MVQEGPSENHPPSTPSGPRFHRQRPVPVGGFETGRKGEAAVPLRHSQVWSPTPGPFPHVRGRLWPYTDEECAAGRMTLVACLVQSGCPLDPLPLPRHVKPYRHSGSILTVGSSTSATSGPSDGSHPGGRGHGLDSLSIQRSRAIQAHSVCVSSTKRDGHARSVDAKSGAHGATYMHRASRPCQGPMVHERAAQGLDFLRPVVVRSSLHSVVHGIESVRRPCRAAPSSRSPSTNELVLSILHASDLVTCTRIATFRKGSRKFPSTYNRPRKVECDFHGGTFDLCCVLTMRGWEEYRRSNLCIWPND